MNRNELLREHLKMETEEVPNAIMIKTVLSVPKGSQDENPLSEALRITAGARQDSYGSPLQDFTRTGALWTALLGLPPGTITPEKVALMMVCLKLSREAHKHGRDNLVDAAGYINCLDMLIEAKKL
jgi:hypothetical protein